VKITNWCITACLGLIWIGATAAAERPYYLGLKGAQVEVHQAEYDNATVAGLVIGYVFRRQDGRFAAAELELIDTISDGEFVNNGNTGRWDIDSADAIAETDESIRLFRPPKQVVPFQLGSPAFRPHPSPFKRRGR